MVRFMATVRMRGPNPFVDVPGMVTDTLLPFAERGRIRVTGRLNGAEFNATLMPVKPGGHILHVPGGLRAATGVKVGDTVTVDVQALDAQQVIPPRDLAAALSGTGGAAEKWDLLSPTHRRELTRFLEDARTQATRIRRIGQIVAQVQGGTAPPPGRRTHGALWTCPRCGQAFVTRNMNHSCERHSLDEPFQGRPAEILRLFDAVRQTIEDIGPVTLVPYRDRVAFMVRVRFAGVQPRNNRLNVNFWLTRRIESPRFQRVETLSPRTHIYTVWVSDPSDVDSELAGWLREAYGVGCQRHLHANGS